MQPSGPQMLDSEQADMQQLVTKFTFSRKIQAELQTF